MQSGFGLSALTGMQSGVFRHTSKHGKSWQLPGATRHMAMSSKWTQSGTGYFGIEVLSHVVIDRVGVTDMASV